MVPYDVMDESREKKTEKSPKNFCPHSSASLVIECGVYDQSVISILGGLYLENQLSPIRKFFAHFLEKNLLWYHTFQMHFQRYRQEI